MNTQSNAAASGQRRLRVLFALPGLHRVNRGAEVAFEAIAEQLSRRTDVAVTLIGSGHERADRGYGFIRSRCIDRGRFRWLPSVPLLRSECVWEELSFAGGLMWKYRPEAYDITVGCSYPFVNWILSRRRCRGQRPLHVHVTQNGDWHVGTPNREYRYFRCDGLVCTNNEYFDRHRDAYPCVLIPNGVDPALFEPGEADRGRFGLPDAKRIVLMVSALIPSKRIGEGVASVARMNDPETHLVVAGDGPLRKEIDGMGHRLLGARFHRISVERGQMPALYQCADVFLHMSQDEPSSNACIEALATGLPIVAHDRAVARWTFQDEAVLVNTDDESAVAAGIIRAAAQRTPAHIESRRAMVNRRFVWSAIADQYMVFFNELMQSRAQQPIAQATA